MNKALVVFILLLSVPAFAAERKVPLVLGELISDTQDKNLIVGSEVNVDFYVETREDLDELTVDIELPLGVTRVQGELNKVFKDVPSKTKLKMSFRVRVLNVSPQPIVAVVGAQESRYKTFDEEKFILILNKKALK
jgi:hypothetical protein